MSFKTFAALGLTLSVGAVSLFIGCSSDDSSGNNNNKDGGGDTGTTPSGSAKFSGTVSELLIGSPVNGATVTLGTVSATTDANGAYSANVPKNTPFALSISASQHANFFDQETTLSGDADRGPSLITSNTIAQALANRLPGFDGTLGVVGIGVTSVGSCPDNGTAVISIDTGAGDAGAGDAGDAGSSDASASAPVVIYVGSNDQPDPNQHSVLKGKSTPSAVAYNVPPGGNISISVKRDGCTQVGSSEYPYADPSASNIKYTGNFTVKAAGNVQNPGVTGNISFVRFFIK